MFASILARAHAGPRPGGNAINPIILALVAGAVALVFRASRPSAIARYPAPPAEAPSAHEEKEPRA